MHLRAWWLGTSATLSAALSRAGIQTQSVSSQSPGVSHSPSSRVDEGFLRVALKKNMTEPPRRPRVFFNFRFFIFLHCSSLWILLHLFFLSHSCFHSWFHSWLWGIYRSCFNVFFYECYYLWYFCFFLLIFFPSQGLHFPAFLLLYNFSLGTVCSHCYVLDLGTFKDTLSYFSWDTVKLLGISWILSGVPFKHYWASPEQSFVWSYFVPTLEALFWGFYSVSCVWGLVTLPNGNVNYSQLQQALRIVCSHFLEVLSLAMLVS